MNTYLKQGVYLLLSKAVIECHYNYNLSVSVGVTSERRTLYLRVQSLGTDIEKVK